MALSYLPTESWSVCSFHVCPQGDFSWPPSSRLLPSSKTLYSISSPAFLSPASQSHTPAFYYPIGDYWRAFFIARGSVQCPCPDCSLVLGHRTQHLNIQHTRPTQQKLSSFQINLISFLKMKIKLCKCGPGCRRCRQAHMPGQALFLPYFGSGFWF